MFVGGQESQAAAGGSSSANETEGLDKVGFFAHITKGLGYAGAVRQNWKILIFS